MYLNCRFIFSKKGNFILGLYCVIYESVVKFKEWRLVFYNYMCICNLYFIISIINSIIL